MAFANRSTTFNFLPLNGWGTSFFLFTILFNYAVNLFKTIRREGIQGSPFCFNQFYYCDYCLPRLSVRKHSKLSKTKTRTTPSRSKPTICVQSSTQ